MKKDLINLQNNYFIASVVNAKEANLAIGKAQGWVLTLGLAELAFLGNRGDFSQCIIKMEITLLLLAFVLFAIGSVAQYKHVLKISRYYFSISSKILKQVEVNETSEVEYIPYEFLDIEVLKTSDTANYFLFTSFILIGISTIMIWFSLIF